MHPVREDHQARSSSSLRPSWIEAPSRRRTVDILTTILLAVLLLLALLS